MLVPQNLGQEKPPKMMFAKDVTTKNTKTELGHQDS